MQVIDPIPVFGDSGLRELRLSAKELATVEAAGAILEKARDLARSVNPATEYGDEQWLDIALAGHTCRDLVEAHGRVTI